MQREKLYNLYTTTYIIVALFIFKTDEISTVRELVVQSLAFLENNYSKLYFVNCGALHAASSGVFRLFLETTY